MKFTTKIITLATLAALTASTWAAIPVPSGTLTFDTLPAVTDWSTKSLAGTSGTFSATNTPPTVLAMDAAINDVGNAASTINTVLGTSTANPPGTAGLAQWSTNKYIQTRPTSVAATLLMATLTNTTGSAVTTLNITYDLASPVVPPSEELPGHRVYYSLSGAAGSWVAVGNYGVVGPQSITLNLSATPWSADTQMYLLFSDDNAVTGNDGSYQIDNFMVTAGAAPLSVFLSAPANGASINSCVTVTATATVGVVDSGAFTDHRTFSPWTPSTLPSLSSGSHTIYVAVSDGVTTLYSTTNTFTITANTAPTISITNTYSGGVTNAAGITYLVGTAVSNQFTVADSDGTVTNIDWLLNGHVLARLPITRTLFIVNDTLAGTNHLTAVAYDNCGLMTTSAVVQIVVTNPPSATDTIILPNGLVWTHYNTNLTNTALFPGGWSEPATNAGLRWMELNYNDSAWASGPASLGGGNTLDSTASVSLPDATDIDIGAPNRYNAVYFRHKFNVSNPASLTNLVVRLLRDDGAVIYLNGSPVWTNNMVVGAVPISFTNLAGGGNNDDGTIYQVANVSPSALISGQNIAAVEMHQSGVGSSDLVFDLMIWGQPGGVAVPNPVITQQDATHCKISWPNTSTFRVFHTADIATLRASWAEWTATTATLNGGTWELIVPSNVGNDFFDLRP